MTAGPLADQRHVEAPGPLAAGAPCRLLLLGAEARLGPSSPDSAYIVLKLNHRSYVSEPTRQDPEDAGLYRWPPPLLDNTIKLSSPVAGAGAPAPPELDEPLCVEILGARGLHGARAPMVSCELVGKPYSRRETPEGDDPEEPVWDYEVEFADYELGDELSFSVYDRDSEEQLLGSATLRAEELREGFDGWLPLSDRGEGGDASLDLKVHPARHRPSTPAPPAPAAPATPPVAAPRTGRAEDAVGPMAELALEDAGPPSELVMRAYVFAASGAGSCGSDAGSPGREEGRGLGFFEVPLAKLKDAGKPRTVLSGPFVPYGGRAARRLSSRCSLKLRASWETCGGLLEGCSALREETRQLCAMLDGLAALAAGAPAPAASPAGAGLEAPPPAAPPPDAGSPGSPAVSSLVPRDASPSQQLTLQDLALGAEQLLEGPAADRRKGGVRGYGRRAAARSSSEGGTTPGLHSPAWRPWRLDLARGIGRAAREEASPGTTRLGVEAAASPAEGRRWPPEEGAEEAQPTQILKVTLVAASGLCKAIGKLDPYGSLETSCACELLGKPASRYATAPLADALEPAWREEAELPGYAPGDSIVFTVYGGSPGRSQQVLGTATLSPEELDSGGGFTGNLVLKDAGRSIEAYLKVRVRPGVRVRRAAPSPAPAATARRRGASQPAAARGEAQAQQRPARQQKPALQRRTGPAQRQGVQPKQALPRRPRSQGRPAAASAAVGAEGQRAGAGPRAGPEEAGAEEAPRPPPRPAAGGPGASPLEAGSDEASRYLREHRHLRSDPALEARLARWLPPDRRRPARPATAPVARPARQPTQPKPAWQQDEDMVVFAEGDEARAAQAAREVAAEERVRSAARRRFTSLRAAFGAFDADADGLVSFAEFRRGVGELGLPAPLGAELLEALWRRADCGGLGYLSMGRLGEFLGIVR